MSASLSAADLLDQLEQLSPAALEGEIAELKERITRAERILKMIRGNDAATRREKRSTGASDPKPVVDKTVDHRDRVFTFLQINGPSTFRAIMVSVGMSPVQLKQVLEGDHSFVFYESEKKWSLKHSR